MPFGTRILGTVLAMLTLLGTGSSAYGQKQAPPPTDPPKTPYVVIPLSGQFGEDFDETGVEDILQSAVTFQANNVLIVIDSPGGSVLTARAIRERLKGTSGMTFTCDIKRGISASLYVIVSCDDVYIEKGGAAGAAVHFEESDTGEVSVDAKMNAAAAADLSSAAAAKGQVSPLLVRAMVERDVEVWGREGPEPDTVHLSDTPPADPTGWVQIDTKDRVLALTADQAIKWGFATDWAARDCFLRGSWQVVDDGRAAMQRSKQRCHDFKDVLAVVKNVRQVALPAALRALHPDKYDDYVHGSTTWADRTDGKKVYTDMTTASRKVWHSRMDQYLAGWAKVGDQVKRAAELVKRNEQRGLPETITSARTYLESVWEQVPADAR